MLGAVVDVFCQRMLLVSGTRKCCAIALCEVPHTKPKTAIAVPTCRFIDTPPAEGRVAHGPALRQAVAAALIPLTRRGRGVCKKKWSAATWRDASPAWPRRAVRGVHARRAPPRARRAPLRADQPDRAHGV